MPWQGAAPNLGWVLQFRFAFSLSKRRGWIDLLSTMKISYRALELIKASEIAVVGTVKGWWQANGYTLRSNSDPAHLSAVRGLRIGLTDRQTQRIMVVILKPVSDGRAVSVYHHTGRILCVVGTMFTDILQSETDSFLHYFRENAATDHPRDL